MDSVFSQDYRDFEVILVDNASTDGSVEFVRAEYPDVVVVESDRNVGFAGGNNLGLGKARGDYILLLNNDTVVEKELLANLLTAFESIPSLGSVQPKIVSMENPDKLEPCGMFWTKSSFLYFFGDGEDESLSEYNKPVPVFANNGAAMLIRKDVIIEIGLFTDDYWCYYEDADLGNRMWLAGYECWYYPCATVYHARGNTARSFDSGEIQYHYLKNKLMSILSNLEIRSLLAVLPPFLLMNTLLAIIRLLKGQFGISFALVRAICFTLQRIPQIVSNRKRVKQIRRVPDREIFRRTRKNPGAGYYYRLLLGRAH